MIDINIRNSELSRDHRAGEAVVRVALTCLKGVCMGQGWGLWILDKVDGGLHQQECEQLEARQQENNMQVNAELQDLDLIMEKPECGWF